MALFDLYFQRVADPPDPGQAQGRACRGFGVREAEALEGPATGAAGDQSKL